MCLFEREKPSHSLKEAHMTSIADGSVRIQTSAESVPAPSSWFGEVVLMAAYLREHGVLTNIAEGVRFARRRFGRYEVIDFLAVLFGYAISGERTLEAFYERLQPFAVPFMALFDRDQLPARSTLSRFLAQLPEAPVEALRTLFLDDLESRPLATESTTANEKQTGDCWIERATPGWSLTSTGRAGQIEQLASRKIVQSRAVRHGKTPQLQSFLNQKMEELKEVGIHILRAIPVANQRSTAV
jgi:hypothetical protein